ncbi:hypothetical protein LXA43DRAFT_444339 [Ganoderma leucocontextum]|nr:hypothetical protein LXA43DRAFT_444339 [Ganoderma leucocontextum]
MLFVLAVNSEILRVVHYKSIRFLRRHMRCAVCTHLPFGFPCFLHSLIASTSYMRTFDQRICCVFHPHRLASSSNAISPTRRKGRTESPFPTTLERNRAPSTFQYTSQFTEKSHHGGSRRKRSSYSHRPSASSNSALKPSPPIEAITNFPMVILTNSCGLVSVDRAHPLWFFRCGKRKKPPQTGNARRR